MIRQVVLIFFIGATIAHPKPSASPDAKTKVTPQTPLVTTPLGQIQGSTLTSRLGKQIYAFRGIRYAKAPIEDLRFQPPVAVDKWDGLYNATEDGPVCPQATTDTVSEDCLRLNVYTTKLPKQNDTPKRPVIVFIHGGAFQSLSGISSWAGPQYLMDHEVVLVTINYRLGSLGFLSVGEKDAPGNFGLKDQVQALKWVKQNIAQFGGNPESVTLMGYSSGAASVTLHLVSPMSQGLFHKAIIMSGSSYGQWPVPHHQLDLAKKQAKMLGCPEDTSATNIVKCLKTKTANEIGESYNKFAEFGEDPVLIWYPVIEDDFGQERFLPSHPIYLLQNGQHASVPVLIGVTNDEFAGRAFNVVRNTTLAEEMQNNWEKNAPIAFLYERETENSRTISKALKTTYFNEKSIDNSSLAELAQLYADALSGFGVNRAAKLLADKNHSVYYYKFSYKGRYSHFYLPDSNGTVPYGVVHHDDLMYLFNMKLFPEFKEADPEYQTVNKLTLLWTNFAKTGNPIPESTETLDNAKWEPFTTKTQKYMDIGNKLVLSEKMFEKRYSEWEKLFPLSHYTKKNKHSG